jgi:hypothetical protein
VTVRSSVGDVLARGDGTGIGRCAEELGPVATTAVRVRILLALVHLLDLLVGGDAVGDEVQVKEEEHRDESPRNERVEDDEYVGGVGQHDRHKGVEARQSARDQAQSEVRSREGHHPQDIHQRHRHEPQEVAVVALADAVADPGTVVIEAIHAVVAYAAVHCARWSVDVARVCCGQERISTSA